MLADHFSYSPLELSSKVEYALLTLLELVSHANRKYSPLTIPEIASKHAIPERYLEKIMTLLRRDGIVRSYRGARGGYVLAQEPQQISLFDVMALVDGERKPKELEMMPNLERQIVYQVWQELNTVSQKFLTKVDLSK